MPFIGNQPALSYTSFAKQDFTTSATTSYTLDNPVTNENELALFINFVRQEPTTAYTASGTSLTLTSATSASDDMYCVFLGKAVQTVNPPSGSVGLSQLSATGTKDATTFLRGDNTFASAGGTNTPSFKATASANQSIPHSTETLVVFDTEVYDTNNAFNNTSSGNGYSFTVPSGQGGKYLLTCSTRADGWTTPRFYITFYVNGSNTMLQDIGNGGSYSVVNPVYIEDLSAGDYVQCRIFHQNGSSQNVRRQETFFQGFKLIGV